MLETVLSTIVLVIAGSIYVYKKEGSLSGKSIKNCLRRLYNSLNETHESMDNNHMLVLIWDCIDKANMIILGYKHHKYGSESAPWVIAWRTAILALLLAGIATRWS